MGETLLLLSCGAAFLTGLGIAAVSLRLAARGVGIAPGPSSQGTGGALQAIAFLTFRVLAVMVRTYLIF
jgi:hypothetical protein